jgi:hypothetical protein
MYQPSLFICVACFICHVLFAMQVHVSFLLLCADFSSEPAISINIKFCTSTFNPSSAAQQQCQLHQLHQSGIYCVELLLASPVVYLNDLLAQRGLLSIKNEC